MNHFELGVFKIRTQPSVSLDTNVRQWHAKQPFFLSSAAYYRSIWRKKEGMAREAGRHWRHKQKESHVW